MKKILTELELNGIKGKINYARATIKEFRSFEIEGVSTCQVISTYERELAKWENELKKYRQDVVFITANKVVKYKK